MIDFTDLDDVELARAASSMRGQSVESIAAEYIRMVAMARHSIKVGEMGFAHLVEQAATTTAAFMHPICCRPSDTTGDDWAFQALVGLSMAQSAAVWDAALRYRVSRRGGLPVKYEIGDLDEVVDPGDPDGTFVLQDLVEASLERFGVEESDVRRVFRAIGTQFAPRKKLISLARKMELDTLADAIESLPPAAVACLAGMYGLVE